MSRSFSLTLLLSMITVLTTTTMADTPDCPYPCLPPPTSGGMINGYPPPPPAAAAGGGASDGFGGSYLPPPPGSFQLTPPGVMPGYFAPPFSSIPTGPAPPPPNPVVPWFPWYYQHTNPITGSTTSASSPTVRPRSTRLVGMLLPLCLVILLRAL